MREKLIELLADDVCPMFMVFGESMDDLVDYLIANGVTLDYQVSSSKWISVKDRLPALHTDEYEEPDGSRMQFEVSDDQLVITASGDQVKARYETGVVFQGWVGDFGNTVRNVTHWMPLPEPPKGG